MHDNKFLNLIRNRRSIRSFTQEDIDPSQIEAILDAGRWAPSGLNNQPWKFSVVKNPEIRDKLSALTKYERIIKECNCCILIFYHTPSGYNRDKDIMSIGACIENMLLAIEALGLGAVWLGEILNRKNDVNRLLSIDDSNELMAVIALGHPAEQPTKERLELNALILNNYY